MRMRMRLRVRTEGVQEVSAQRDGVRGRRHGVRPALRGGTREIAKKEKHRRSAAFISPSCDIT
jgi:hypothetical protein